MPHKEIQEWEYLFFLNLKLKELKEKIESLDRRIYFLLSDARMDTF